MRYSIIIPVYKVEAYLEQCVDSVLQQTFRDFELILVDDGSPDRCPQICDSYAERDCRVKVIHKENGGLSDARNAGIHAAIGEYLLFLDSDDYWTTDAVLEKIDSVISQWNVDIVQFGQESFYSKEGKVRPGPERNLAYRNGGSTRQLLPWLIIGGNMKISACSMAISRKFIVDNKVFFKKGLKTEDLEWAIRLYLCEPRWGFIDEYFYIYRVSRAGSITASIDYKHLCDYCWILESSVERVERAAAGICQPLMSYLMYHVLIAAALAYRASVGLTKVQRREIFSRLTKISKGRVTRYTLSPKVRLASYVYRVGGFPLMAMVLGFYLNHRGR